MLADTLQTKGYAVITAGDGQEGLSCFDHAPCDLVITDMQMPTMDSPTFIHALHQRQPTLPIIGMAAGIPATLIDLERQRLNIQGFFKTLQVARPPPDHRHLDPKSQHPC